MDNLLIIFIHILPISLLIFSIIFFLALVCGITFFVISIAKKRRRKYN